MRKRFELQRVISAIVFGSAIMVVFPILTAQACGDGTCAEASAVSKTETKISTYTKSVAHAASHAYAKASTYVKQEADSCAKATVKIFHKDTKKDKNESTDCDHDCDHKNPPKKDDPCADNKCQKPEEHHEEEVKTNTETKIYVDVEKVVYVKVDKDGHKHKYNKHGKEIVTKSLPATGTGTLALGFVSMLAAASSIFAYKKYFAGKLTK